MENKFEIVSKNPNFHLNSILKQMNDCFGINDIFDIFYDKKNNNELYLISPCKGFLIEITRLRDNQLIKLLKGHDGKISLIRHFFDERKQINYLVSSGKKSKVNVWDLTNNYNLLFSLNVDYSENSIIFSCVLFFSENKGNFLIVSSNENSHKDFTKIYDFENHQLIANLEATNFAEIYYLLLWNNGEKDYLIGTSIGRVLIHNLETKELFHILNSPKISVQNSACLIKSSQTNKIDLLSVSTVSGNIDFWDLNTFKIKFSIKYNKSYFYHLINWNNRYLIVAEKFNSLILIIDIVIRKIITSIKDNNDQFVVSLKKINHPLYGHSLLSSDLNNTITLWTN